MKNICIVLFVLTIIGCGTIGTMHPSRYHPGPPPISIRTISIIPGTTDSLEVKYQNGETYRSAGPEQHLILGTCKLWYCTVFSTDRLRRYIFYYSNRRWFSAR
jgi:hypothetical protein